MGWTFYNSSGEALTSFGDVALGDIDIDGGTDIGAAIVDADLFIIDDGAGGTNRKTAASRIATYIGTDGDKSVRVYDGSTQSISNATQTAVAFDTETFDTDVMHDNSTNNARLTAKTAGKYLVTAHVGFAADGTGVREIHLNHSVAGDIAVISRNAEANRTNYVSVATVYAMDVDEYVTCQVYQNSGGSLNVLNGVWHSFQMAKISG